MENKKKPKFDLENKRNTFFTIGLTIALLMVLFAFKNYSEVRSVDTYVSGPSLEPELVIIPITREPEDILPAPPEFKLFDEIKVVENTVDIPDPDIKFDDLHDPLPEPIKITEEIAEEVTIFIPEKWPEFPGGMKSLNKWLSNEISYPYKAMQLGLTGRVYLSFIVDKMGTISNVNVTRGVDKLLDEEAIRVIASMPKWKPGLQNGKPVEVTYNLFVTFKLD